MKNYGKDFLLLGLRVLFYFYSENLFSPKQIELDDLGLICFVFTTIKLGITRKKTTISTVAKS